MLKNCRGIWISNIGILQVYPSSKRYPNLRLSTDELDDIRLWGLGKFVFTFSSSFAVSADVADTLLLRITSHGLGLQTF